MLICTNMFVVFIEEVYKVGFLLKNFFHVFLTPVKPIQSGVRSYSNTKSATHIPHIHQQVIGKPAVSGDEKLWFGGGGVPLDADSIGKGHEGDNFVQTHPEGFSGGW